MLKFRTHGKWILAGEHSVLRGGTALVFPVASRYLDFHWQEAEKLSLIIQHPNSDLEMAFWGVFERALQNLEIDRSQIKGKLTLSSNIPVGAGMGASATLCVSLAHWFEALGFLDSAKKYDFAKDLENLFHGESSGVDVAVALNHQALKFSRPSNIEYFKPMWTPQFYLSYCGKRGVTADCISRVQELISEQPELGTKIDNQMKQSVATCELALSEENQLSLLKEGIDLARDCFKHWGLISHELEDHMDLLTANGALATKPTGSGDGGFVLSLWDKKPEIPGVELIEA